MLIFAQPQKQQNWACVVLLHRFGSHKSRYQQQGGSKLRQGMVTKIRHGQSKVGRVGE
jgi:hypothetical protein